MAAEVEGFVTFDRLKDHYKHCIRLSASNKINPKNAFDLQLIDYMQDLVSNTEDGQLNFKIASSALDVGAKIYSNRVDRIQSEAQKVASSILMALDGQANPNQAKNPDNLDDSQQDPNNTANSEELNDSNNQDADGQSKAKKKKRSSRNKNVKTVVTDDNLLDAKLEKMVVGDAFLGGLSQDYDMSCPAALICYNAMTQPNCLLTIESDNMRKDYREAGQQEERPAQQEAHQDSAASMEDSGHESGAYITLITKNVNCAQIIRNCQSEAICPKLNSFLFNDRTTSVSGLNANQQQQQQQEQQSTSILESSRAQAAGGAHEFNPELYDDDCGLDNGVGDGYGSGCDADSVTGDARPAANAERDRDNERQQDLIENLDRIAACKPTDYGYSTEHHRLVNTWAGPYAWKAVRAPQTARKEAPKSTRKRSKIEQQPIDFGEEYSPALEKLSDKEIRFSSDVIRRWKKPMRLQDYNLSEEAIRSALVHTFARPEDTYHCVRSAAEARKLVDKDHDYSLTAPAGAGGVEEEEDDDEPFGAGCLSGLGFDDDNEEHEFRADPVVDGNEVAIYGANLDFAGEHLIEQPYTVAQLLIPFAKTAKKMDVRKLKRVMWDLLLPADKRLELTNGLIQNVTMSGEQPGPGPEPEAAEEEEQHSTSKGPLNGAGAPSSASLDGDKTLPGAIDALPAETEPPGSGAGPERPSPAPSESAVHLDFSSLYGELPVRVSSKMATDLSQPIAFVTLLHLANEKNLKLIPRADLKDFTIEQDEFVL